MGPGTPTAYRPQRGRPRRPAAEGDRRLRGHGLRAGAAPAALRWCHWPDFYPPRPGSLADFSQWTKEVEAGEGSSIRPACSTPTTPNPLCPPPYSGRAPGSRHPLRDSSAWRSRWRRVMRWIMVMSSPPATAAARAARLLNAGLRPAGPKLVRVWSTWTLPWKFPTMFMTTAAMQAAHHKLSSGDDRTTGPLAFAQRSRATI